MGENNMFEGLGDELKRSDETEQAGDEADSSESEPADPAPSPAPEESDASPTTEEPSTEEPSTEEPSSEEDSQGASDAAPPSHNQPAFPFVNNHVESIYPRPETWDEFRDVVDLDLERTFREHGVRNMSGREIHDAALRLAAENPNALARIALEARGIDYEP